MNRKISFTLVLLLLGIVALLLVACGGGAETVECPEQETCPECAECPEPAVDTGPEIPALEAWKSSGHADASAEAFRHWDEDDPAVIPASCAKCHSTHGYRDFVGADGTDFGAIDAEGFAADTTVECVACHNQGTASMTSVVMPSGIELTGLGVEARCMQCHQGRSSGLSVDEATAEMDEDAVNEELGFINIHYYAAAATKYGTMAKGGYEYDGKSYDGFFAHVPEYDACQECHNPHTLELKLTECAQCHEGVASVEDLRDVRMVSSAVDYDGDGDVAEGVYYEIEALKEQLYAAIQVYAADMGNPIAYNSAAYPYFFADLNGDGEAGEDEANYGNQYKAWTPRLLKAAYNYQVALKDPGGYAHGGKYIIQLLVDSTEDLGVDISDLRRIDHGHFAGSEEAFRHWDEDGYEVPASCSKCHSAAGLPLFIEEGVTITQEASNGFLCETCHGGGPFPQLYEVSSVTFPSGTTISSEEPEAQFLCMQCHQGRASGQSVAGAIAGKSPDTPDESLRFINVHYFAAGATRYGSEVTAMYEYSGKEYAGYFGHVDSFSACMDCHDAHELEIQANACAGCHGTEDLTAIRIRQDDFDGDGDITEGLAGEVAGLTDLLYAEMQAYAALNSNPLVYDSHAYPYFFIDTNGDGQATPDEANYGNQYTGWTPRLLSAAYNYQYALKDPGAFTHNGTYVIQVLIDSIADLGGDVSGLVRP